MNTTENMNLIEDYIDLSYRLSNFLLDNPVEITKFNNVYALFNDSKEVYDIFVPTYSKDDNNEIDITVEKIYELKDLNIEDQCENLLNHEYMDQIEMTSEYVAVIFNTLTAVISSTQIYFTHLFGSYASPTVPFPKMNGKNIEKFKESKYMIDTFMTTMSKNVSYILQSNGFDINVIFNVSLMNNTIVPHFDCVEAYSNQEFVDISSIYTVKEKPYKYYDVLDASFLSIASLMMACNLTSIIAVTKFPYEEKVRNTIIGMSGEYLKEFRDLNFYVPGYKLSLSRNVLNRYNVNRSKIWSHIHQLHNISKTEYICDTDRGIGYLSKFMFDVSDMYSKYEGFFDTVYDECNCMPISKEVSDFIASSIVKLSGSVPIDKYNDIENYIAITIVNVFNIFERFLLLTIYYISGLKRYGSFDNSSFNSIDDVYDYIFSRWKPLMKIAVTEVISNIFGTNVDCSVSVGDTLLTLNHDIISQIENALETCNIDELYRIENETTIKDWLNCSRYVITVHIIV